MNSIKLEADINTLDERNYVTFRAAIDESEPETVIVKMIRGRWDRLGRPTKIPIVLFPSEELNA